jgi:NADPH:quinone reductase-like Zn-dependent oxidoreductase
MLQVGSDAKREQLLARFANLHAENISNSHDAAEFEMHINRCTKGRGVDVVLNSLADEKLQVRTSQQADSLSNHTGVCALSGTEWTLL